MMRRGVRYLEYLGSEKATMYQVFSVRSDDLAKTLQQVFEVLWAVSGR